MDVTYGKPRAALPVRSAEERRRQHPQLTTRTATMEDVPLHLTKKSADVERVCEHVLPLPGRLIYSRAIAESRL